MSHRLSEPDNPQAPQLSGVLAKGYRPVDPGSPMHETKSRSRMGVPGSMTAAGPDINSDYAPDRFAPVHPVYYNKPDHSDMGRQVEPPVNFESRLAEANGYKEDSIDSTLNKIGPSAYRPK